MEALASSSRRTGTRGSMDTPQVHLLQAHVGAPVDRAQVVAVVEVAVVEKLLAERRRNATCCDR